MTAAIDLALAFVEDDHGRDLALAPSDRVARVLSYVQRHPNEDLDERMRRAFLRRLGKCPQEPRRDQAASPPLAVVGKEAPCLEMRQI